MDEHSESVRLDLNAAEHAWLLECMIAECYTTDWGCEPEPLRILARLCALHDDNVRALDAQSTRWLHDVLGPR